MTTGYAVPLRNGQLEFINTYAGPNALLRIYTATRPATGAAITSQVKLAELVCGAVLGTVAAAVLTFEPITDDLVADATGAAAWFRIVKADGTTFVMDGSVGTSGADLILTTTAFNAGQLVEITSIVITRGNP